LARPNLLFIFTDEQRADTLGAYGNRRIGTPNLDRLAAGSILFENAYVTQSVCTPSRSTIMTGLWPHTNACTANNIPLEPGTPTIAEMMDRRDVAFGYHGKWHLGDEVVAQHGFEDWVSIEDFYWMHSSREEYKPLVSDYCQALQSKGIEPDKRRGEKGQIPVYSRGFCARLPEELGKPAFLAESACRFIEEHKKDRFVLYVNFLEPHMPFFGPRDEQYPAGQVGLPANFECPVPGNAPAKCRRLAERFHKEGFGGDSLRTESDWRRLVARYWGLVSLVDTHAGRILDKLTECGLEENTVVVFTSDHGDMMASHKLLAKCVEYEEALKVPMLIRAPGVSPRRVAGRVSQIDLVPTLLELMDEEIPDRLQGKSLAPEIRGERPFRAEDVFAEWNSSDIDPKQTPDPDAPDLAVRTAIDPAGWKLNWAESGESELYNLAADPLETVNLYSRAEHKEIAAKLKEKICAWQERTGDELKLPG